MSERSGLRLAGALFGACILASLPGVAADPPPKREVVYKPPVRGAPPSRVSGGTRGSTPTGVPVLEVLAPNDIGFTLREQPTLYWYNSSAVQTQLQLTLAADDKSVDPLLEVDLAARQVPAGINSFSLTGTAVKLRPDTEYIWSVSLVLDPRQRSRDVVASGLLKRVSPPGGLERNAGGSPVEAAIAYAGAGFWYDAVEALSAAVAKSPDDRRLRELRAGLMDQVGLKEAASFDRSPQ
jgi:hypothetical protein